MIIWSGRGILSFLVLVFSFVLFIYIIPSEQGIYAFVLSFFAAAAFSWFMGKKWNQGKAYIDKETGQEVIFNPNHSVFWIKMEYWGVVFGLIGLILLIISLA